MLRSNWAVDFSSRGTKPLEVCIDLKQKGQRKERANVECIYNLSVKVTTAAPQL